MFVPQKRIIVTAGAAGSDIDVYACAIAYAELLKLRGYDAIPVISPNYTASVTQSVLLWGNTPYTSYIPQKHDDYVIVDMSDPAHIPPFVNHARIREVYDHRYGFQSYWSNHLQNGVHIDLVGSCGTLIWEQYRDHGYLDTLSLTAARLLFASIVSNCLAMRAPITTDRDRNAYDHLKAKAHFADAWIATYFHEQECALLSDFAAFVHADTKCFRSPYGDIAIAQIELWDAQGIYEKKKEALADVMSTYDKVIWFANILDISRGRNIIFSRHTHAREILSRILPCTGCHHVEKNECVKLS
jgi:inorganic pyrophosphatase/exopolyphosphatase